MTEFWKNNVDIKEDINKVEIKMKMALNTKSPSMKKIIDYLLDSKGKYVRSGLMILTAKNGTYDSDRITTLAASMELVHLASLVHDDIIDDSDIRRGRESMQSRFGKDTAVYTGDYIFAKAYRLVATNYIDHIDRFADRMESLCMGEVIQNENRYNSNLNVRKYLRIISGKTASLFGLSMFLGTYEGGYTEKESRDMGRCGYYAGMAFQIIDDCLDYSSDASTMGKNTRADLLNGIYTLPVIYALKNDNEGRLKDCINERELDVSKVIDLVIHKGGIEKSMALADKYTQKSINILKDTRYNNNEAIMEVMEKLLKRKY
jgi:heptaprenyl diphosphate synthase